MCNRMKLNIVSMYTIRVNRTLLYFTNKNLRFVNRANHKKNCNLHPISNLKADSESSENSTYFSRKKNNFNVQKSWNTVRVFEVSHHVISRDITWHHMTSRDITWQPVAPRDCPSRAVTNSHGSSRDITRHNATSHHWYHGS
jgi:hypothetical protein